MKQFIILLSVLASPIYAQMDSDAKAHYNQAKREATIATVFLVSTMVAVPVDNWLCSPSVFGCTNQTAERTRIITGTILGSISLSFAAWAWHDYSWFQIKYNRSLPY